MAKGFRPKFRWAAKYLKERYGPDGAKLPSSILEPTYNTFGRLLNPPFEKDEYFLVNEKDFVTGGPYLWISKLLQERGPLTRKELWALYQRDESLDKEDIPINSRIIII
jgi:hypothetical protein